MGVTEMRLFTMGMPNSASISSPVFTRSLAERVILSYIFRQAALGSASQQSSREMPIVTVRTSRCCWSIISMVCKISPLFIMSSIPPYDHRGGAAYPGGLVPLGFYILCMALKMSSR